MQRLGIGITMGEHVSSIKLLKALDEILPEDSKQRERVQRFQKMIHFKELRSGKDLAYYMRRTIKYNVLSGGKSASHLVDRNTFDHYAVTLYDYDLLVEFLAVVFAFLLLVRALFSSRAK